MAKAILGILKVLMILIFSGWISLWILKPTELWTRKWKGAEESARTTLFGYYGTYFRLHQKNIVSTSKKFLLIYKAPSLIWVYNIPSFKLRYIIMIVNYIINANS